MQRTSIVADDATLQRLKGLAHSRGVSFATVVREALEEKASTYHPLPRSLGAGQSGARDTAIAVASSPQPPRSWR